MNEFLPNNTVFVFLTASGKPTGYSFTYSSNHNVHHSNPEEDAIWNKNKIRLLGSIVDTLGDPDFDMISSEQIKSKEIDSIDMDMKLLEKIEELSFYTHQQEEKINELKQKAAAFDMLKDEVTSLKQMVGDLMNEN